MHKTAPEIILIDDDPSFLRAITRQITVLGYTAVPFADSAQGIRYLQSGRGTCLIVDLHMPGMTGLDVQGQLAGLPVPIVFLSGQATIPATVQAMQNGAVTFLEKPVEVADLQSAVDTALRSSAMMHAQQKERARAADLFEALTDRQKEVFQVLVTGAPNKVIAHELGISERTVKAHRQAIMERLQAESIADIFKLASELGKTPSDQPDPI